MIITFGNQKGGTGKSTLAILLSNFLTKEKGKSVLVLDMDFQKTIFNKYRDDKLIDGKELYPVQIMSLEKFGDFISILEEFDDQIIIIDLPGKLDDKNLIPVIMHTDIFVIPFAYDEFSYVSTAHFTFVAKELNKKARMFFVPNKNKKRIKYELKDSILQDFNQYGSITKEVTDLKAYTLLSTKTLQEEVTSLIYPVFEPILQLIENEQNTRTNREIGSSEA